MNYPFKMLSPTLFYLCQHKNWPGSQHTILRQIGRTNDASFLRVSGHFSEWPHTWERTLSVRQMISVLLSNRK